MNFRDTLKMAMLHLRGALFLSVFVLCFVRGVLGNTTKEGSKTQGLAVVLKSDREVYRNGDVISLQYIFQNTSTTELHLVPWNRGYTTNWLEVYEESTRKKVKTLPLVLYELKPFPDGREDFLLLKPGKSHIVILAGVVRKEPLEIRQQVFHKEWWLDFKDSAFLLTGPGIYLAKAKYNSPAKWEAIGENRFGLRNVWVGDLESSLIRVRIEE